MSNRIAFMPREKTAYLVLRRVGLSINQISKAFGRSTSVVHRILTKNERFGYNKDVWLRRMDLRKYPWQLKMRLCTMKWQTMLKLIAQWEQFICGEEAKPP